MSIPRRHLVVFLFLGWATLTAGVAAAQPVPIPGVTGTIAPPANVDKFYSDLNKILAETAEGIDHVVDGKKDRKARNESASLDSLRPGTPVEVRYTIKGIQTSPHALSGTEAGGPRANEGIVTKVDGKQVTIRFSNGGTQTLRYTSRATTWSEGHVRHGDRAIVYSSDESGRKKAHYFKPLR
jgi:hypothetical protein